MDIKVTGPRGPQKTEKSKKSQKSGGVGGTSFASMLESAGDVAETGAPEQIGGVTGVMNHLGSPVPLEIPTEPEEHGAFLLEQLEELEKDILSGSPTEAVEKLKQALEQSPLNEADLTDKQREILDALHLRAAVELAKMES